jgi:hypothetical protein
VGYDVSVDSETLLVTVFINLKIKPTQPFRVAHKSMVYMRVFIGVSAHMCMSIYVYTTFLKNHKINYSFRQCKICGFVVYTL